MQKHLDQASHNLALHTSLCQNFTDQYHDWRITLLFYSALHYLKALANSKKIDIGNTHFEIEANCNPRRKGAMPVSQRVWANYKTLFNCSQIARYGGINDKFIFEELMKEDYELFLQHLELVKKYVKGMGLTTI